MKIEFKNLGCIEQGSVELNDFTIFCGKNNSGKTYAMYSIYGLFNQNYKISFDFVEPIVNKLKKDCVYYLDISELIKYKADMVSQIESNFEEHLPALFGVTNSSFLNTKIRLFFSDEEIIKRIEKISNGVFSIIGLLAGELRFTKNDENIEITLSHSDIDIFDTMLQRFISETLMTIIFFSKSNELFKNYFLLPAEREGINLFFKELLSIRNLLLQQSQNDNVNPMYLLKDIVESRYAEPIKDYMQYLNNMRAFQTTVSSYSEYGLYIEDKILGGKYEVEELKISFVDNIKNKLPLHFSSSTVKSLFGLVFYLKHIAKKGNYLMIDEPELNLHPDNQRQVARVLAQLVNAGLKVIVSTHSDYFVRELNNLIMLKKDFTGAKELQEKYGYQDNELLDGEKQVSAYLFDDKKVTQIKLDKDEGIIAETFDDVINKLNQSSKEIYYTMQDAKEVIE